MNHFEDIIFRQGPSAQIEAINNIIGLCKGGLAETKMDGSPVIIFGKDESGTFMMNDKNRFFAKTYDGKAKNVGHLYDTITRRREDEAQLAYASDMMHAFTVLKEYCEDRPPGFWVGEALWLHPRNLSSELVVQPNIVQYMWNSPIKEKVGISVHTYLEPDFSKPLLTDFTTLSKDENVYFHYPENITLSNVDTDNIEKRLDNVKNWIEINAEMIEGYSCNKGWVKLLYRHNCNTNTFDSRSYSIFYDENDFKSDIQKNLFDLLFVINILNNVKNELITLLEKERNKYYLEPIQYCRNRTEGEGFIVNNFKLVRRDYRDKTR